MRNPSLLKNALLLALLLVAASAVAQTKYWTGGSGAWADGAKWSLTPDGAGGAGVPRANENVVITSSSPAVITLPAQAWCSDLRVDASASSVRIQGAANAEVHVGGAWQMLGNVRWEHAGTVRLIMRRGGVELDLRGIQLAGRLIFDGSGTWSMISDLVINSNMPVVLKQGTLITNGNLLKAGNLSVEGRGAKRIIAGTSVVMLSTAPDMASLQAIVEPGTSTLSVNGATRPFAQPLPAEAGEDRDVNVCGTGPGQTPFVVDAQLTSNFNGFGVQCRGQCNATVTVTVNGGVGPFTYQWLNGGPPSATWTAACGGPQIVIVTDVGQGISCPVQVQVSEPGPLGVIFFGTGTPPSCADVCDGSRTALAVGGVTPHIYNWNNGAGNNSSFFQLCAGLNTLEITDANGCSFDTTFFFNVQPIQPNLLFSGTSCFGECDGTAGVAPSGGTGNLTITWTPAPPIGQGTPNVSGLCAGNYTVTIADANGCDTTVAFVIDEPPPILIDASSTDATCSGTCDGTATVSASGAVGPFSFVWNPAPGSGQGTGVVSGLCEGLYTVLVTDLASGCDTLVTIEIEAPGALDLQPTVNDATCSDACDGSIQVVVSGGTPPYGFVWSPVPPVGQGTASISGLCAGPWQLTLTDAAGCDTTVVYDVGAPPPIDASLSFTDVSCAGECDGTAEVNVSGGTPGYTFLWSPAPAVGQGTANVSGLCAGPYSVLVTDLNGCDTTVVFEILEPLPLEAIPTQTDLSCGSVCDGTASVAVSGGVPAYTYLWSPAPGAGQGTANASGLCAGNYSVLITDANGCELEVDFLIEDAVPIELSLQVLPASCPGVCDGSAGVIPSGGVPPYAFLWSPEPGSGQGTANVTGLCAQAYTLTVTDAVGCDTTIAFTIDEPLPIEANATVTDASCANECDGSIVLAPSGGTGVFTYVWSPAPPVGQGTATASGLCAGSWQVTITSGACDTTLVFEILQPAPLVVDLVTTDPDCATDCNGTASLSVSGGVPGYTYVWNPAPPVGQGTPDASGLCAGPYSVTIADANGCDTTVAFVITEPLPLEAIPSQTDLTCGSTCDGVASVAVSGGVPGYTYVWTPAPPVGQGTSEASSLCTGDYSVLITDANGCELTVDFTIEDAVPIELSLQVLPATCPNTCDGSAGVIPSGGVAPYTFLWSPAPGSGQGTANAGGLCAQAYTLTVTDAVGCDTTIAFTVLSPDAIEANATVSDASCSDVCDGSIVLNPAGGNGNFTFVWSPQPPVGQGTANVSNLCAGQWQVVIGSGACDTTLTFEILEPLPLAVDLVTTDLSCSGDCNGTATLSVSGGTANYTFLWTPAPPAGQGTEAVSGLCAGNYTVAVTDANGCDTTLVFEILENQPIVVDLVLTPAGCDSLCAGTATATVSGGVGPYQYIWGPGVIAGQGTATASGLCSGIFSLIVVDSFGCDTTLQFIIPAPSGIDAAPVVGDVNCFGACDGTVMVTTTGGSAPYTWLWDPAPPVGQGSPMVSGLCAGVYTLLITDAVACDTTLQIVITEPQPLLPNGSSINESCNGPCDGSASVVPTGGTAPYSFIWSPLPPLGQGTANASGLCPGDWSVTISDASGCDTTVTFTILDQQPIDAGLVVTDALCTLSCDGTATVSPSNGVAPYTFLWSPEPGAGQGTENASGLCAGSYSVLITDALGCDTTVTFNIAAPAPFIVDVLTEAEDCIAACTGSASVSVSGGTGAFTFVWSPEPGGGQGSANATGLCAGTSYSLTITDGNACDSTITITVDPFEEIIPNSSSTPASCSDACDGTATVGPTGGNGPFTYVWSPEPATGQGTPQATGLCAGVAEVTITDVDGCSIVASVLILAPDPLVSNAVQQDVSCAAECDGSITLSVQGGVAPYLYAWSPAPPTGQGTSSVSGLCAGTYSVLITDANGCTLNEQFTITEPLPLVISTVNTPSQCLVCNGASQLLISGGSIPYFVLWTDAGGNTIGTSDNIQNVCAGVYAVQVTDGNGCVQQLTVPITDADGEVLTTTDGATTCPNTCDGEVAVNFTCSASPCTVDWTDAAGVSIGQSGNVATGLCPGQYFAVVTNASGCISIEAANVVAPVGLITAISSSPVTCSGSCNGSATIGVSGVPGPFTFTWDPAPASGQGTPFATGLCAGVYNITISDGVGCDTTVSVLIVEPDPVALNGTTTDISCSGTCDGTIALLPSGGTAPYTYAWSPAPPAGQSGASLTGLCAGSWTGTVTDANGCSITQEFTINEPLELVMTTSSTPSTCPVCDGTATVDLVGGTAPFVITWSLAGSPVGVDPTITGLCGGLYTVVVVDGSGCSQQATVQVADPAGEVLVPVDGQVSCANDCDGSVSVDLACSAPPCVLQWTDANGDPVAGDVTVVSDLCVGDYTVQVTNADGCVSFATATVAPSQTITPNLSSTAVSCAGDCDGTATVGPVGGVEPYTFLWSNGETTPQASGLCAGVFSVTISDASGCDTTITVLILEPQPLVVTGTAQSVACSGECSGSITAVVSGGTAPYLYVWSPAPPSGQGTATASDLCAGSYTLSVTDASGCISQQTFTIAEPAPLTLSATNSPSECGLCNGTLEVSVSGGTAPYLNLWTLNGSIFGTADSLSGLCAGLYAVQVIDANGCEAALAVPLSDIDGEVTTTTDGLTTCPGDCDGVVSVDFTCSDEPCSIAWFDGAGNDLAQSGNQVTDLCPGAYFVQITNASGCITIDTAFVVSPDPIQPNLSTTPVTCFGDCDGVATIGPTGGTGPYDYFWEPEPINGQGTPQVTELCAGTYTVTITDADGCSVNSGVLILSPDPLEATAAIIPAACFGDCNGSIVLTTQGGTLPYTYVWSPEPPTGQGTNSVQDLCPGTWNVAITDGGGCVVQYSYDIAEPTSLQADVATTDNLCFGDCAGTASVLPSGGVPDYSIIWSNANGDTLALDVDFVDALCSGNYSVQITDANGCTLDSAFTITAPVAIDAGILITNETCFGPCDGTAAVSPSGGTGPYTIFWQPEPPVGQGTEQVSGLCPGEWTVTITDASGCDSTTTFTILPFVPIDANAIVNDVLCGGECTGNILTSASGGLGNYTYVWTPVPPNGQGPEASDLCAGSYTLVITDAVGCDSTFSFNIAEPPVLAVTIDDVTAASCVDALDGAVNTTVSGGTAPVVITWDGPGGFTSSQEDLTGLAPGTYIQTLSDGNGCSLVTTVEVPALSTVLADAGVDQESCTGVSVILDGSASAGAITYSWTDQQGTVVGTTAVVDLGVLAPGTYTFTLTVADGPCTSTDQVTVVVLALPIADAGADRTILVGESTELGGAPSGPPGSTFSWTPDSLLNNGSIGNPTTSPPQTTWFTLTVVGSDGCTSVDSVLVTVVPDIVINSGFTPNSDGRNDTWVIDHIELFPNVEVEIYNRWGEMLFRSVGYRTPWDGRYSGGPVPVGTYYYIIKLNDPEYPDAYTGPLTVIR
jgi:gliding motility-associated-like protein